MCARATLTISPERLREVFGLDEIPELAPRYNVAPSQPIAVVRTPGRLELLRWGFPGAGKTLLVNVRAERAKGRSAFRAQRCLVVIDGFYEWKRDGAKTKTPYLIRRADGEPFAVAGLWDETSGIASCVVITQAARPPLAELHDRMPVVIPKESRAIWLEGSAEAASGLLNGAAAELVMRRVSSYVNKPEHDDARCLEIATSRDLPPQTSFGF